MLSKPIDEPDDKELFQQLSITRKPDFYFSFATDPGHVATRSDYLQSLSKALREHLAEYGLDEIVMHVHKEVAVKILEEKDDEKIHRHQQFPQVVHQLRGSVQF